MKKLTRQQKEILGFVRGFEIINDHPPDAGDVLTAFEDRVAEHILNDITQMEKHGELTSYALPSIDFKLITVTSTKGVTQMKGLTDRQEQILQFISDYISECSYPPTYQEIATNFGIKSKHGVVRHLEALEKKNKISRTGTTARSLKILDQEYMPRQQNADVENLPIVGRVAAGTPILAEENIDDYVVVPRRMIRSAAKHFVLRVQGESMINAGINDGDLVVVRSTDTAEPNQIVVALMNNDNEATVKRLIVRNSQTYLKAENPAIPDIYPQSEWMIQGRVVGLIRDMN